MSLFFSGIGKINKQFSLTLCANAVPHVIAPRKIPVALKEKVKSKLDEMVKEQLIVPVTEPTDWVHPIVVVQKPDKKDIRICMDPRILNKYIKREIFEIPTQDVLFAQLACAKYFSFLDASSAFLQLPLTNESSLLCTIATSFSRYRYLRLPYGISCAPEIFQRCIFELLVGVEGVLSYFDDILVYGKTIEEHNQNLHTVLEKIKNRGSTLNRDKSKFCATEVRFLGHIISASGVSPDERKTRAILEMQSPKNKMDLQRFLGMIVYLSKFLPNLSNETNTLRALLSNKTEWQWTAVEEKSYDNLKVLFSSANTLSFFSPKE